MRLLHSIGFAFMLLVLLFLIFCAVIMVAAVLFLVYEAIGLHIVWLIGGFVTLVWILYDHHDDWYS